LAEDAGEHGIMAAPGTTVLGVPAAGNTLAVRLKVRRQFAGKLKQPDVRGVVLVGTRGYIFRKDEIVIPRLRVWCNIR